MNFPINDPHRRRLADPRARWALRQLGHFLDDDQDGEAVQEAWLILHPDERTRAGDPGE